MCPPVAPATDESMPDAQITDQLNYQWARCVIECCLQRGIDTFFLAPGSRCTPLTLAIAEADRADVHRHFDERALCFAAVGFGRASGRAAAVVCTSGTAVANLLPAVVEASLDGIPLLLFTADRPPELRDAGANQTIDQVKIFGSYVRWFFDLPCPTKDIRPRFVQSTVLQAIDRTDSGPVHLNLMFREPFGATQFDTEQLDVIPPRVSTSIASNYELQLEGGNTVVALGACRASEAAAARELARRHSIPLLADVASGLRSLAHELQLLRSDNPPPDTVVHIGGRFTSKRWLQFLERHPPQHIVHLNSREDRIDPSHQLVQRLVGPLVPMCKGIQLRVSAERAFVQAWRKNSEETRQTVERLLAETSELSEPGVADRIAKLLPADQGLFLGNSMPIRDMDAFGVWPEDQHRRVGANRGASGIDGLVASAFGFSIGSKAPTTALIGDLSLLHDLNSLALMATAKTPVVLVVVNNDGGGIFHFLPVAVQTRYFEEYFAAPHGVRLKQAAELFGLDFCEPRSLPSFESNYQAALAKSRSTLIEVRTDRRDNLALHRRIEAAVRDLSK